MNPVILEYVWLDGHSNLRSKYKTHYVDDININTIRVPKWNYDGSSTYQAETSNSEIILNPVAIYNNPFIRDTPSMIVLCETLKNVDSELIPTETNNRYHADKIFKQNRKLEPWFGIEQEYFMMAPNNTNDSDTPLSFIRTANIKPQGDYYCGVGNQHIMFRKLVEKHYSYCLYAGIKISGVNAEVAPNQWEYQVGPCEGIDAGDMHWVSRYILHKLSEEFNVNISFKPKPIASPWNGSGLHTNFSTTATRDKNGIDVIHKYIELLEPKHMEHLAVYGDNSKRLCGECETSTADKFTCGYGNRGCSVRIPTDTLKNECGYFEDRRPASDADPYNVTSIIFNTCCL